MTTTTTIKRFIVSGVPRLAKQNYNFYPVFKTKVSVNPNQNPKGKSNIAEPKTNDQS